MNIASWYGTEVCGQRVFCVAYFKDAWDKGVTYSYREFWFPWEI
jgi:hypothetical protein